MPTREQLRATVAVATMLAITTPSAAQPAPEEDARAYVKRGVEHYERGELELAIEALEHAHAIEVTAEGCYALGQALRKQGACDRAIPMFRCAVERAPTEKFAQAANYQLGRCVGETATERVATPPPVVVLEPPRDVPPVAPGRPTPWYRDAVGGVLVGLGLGAAGIGGGLLLHAEVRARDAHDDLSSFREAGSVGAERVAGGVALSVGGVLVVGGILRYMAVSGR